MLAAGVEILNVVFPPSQKLVVPEILGAVGTGFTEITVAAETALVQPLEIACTVKLPAADTVMLFAVVPLLHKYVVLAAGVEILSVVFPPSQKVVVPETVGVLGIALTVTAMALLIADVHVPKTVCTV